MATTKRTEGRPVICSCGWPIDGEFQHGTPCTPDCEAPTVDYTERPVVVGEVWEGVLEFRTVEVVAILGAVGSLPSAQPGLEWVKFAVPGQTVCSFAPLAEFRERFTRRG